MTAVDERDREVVHQPLGAAPDLGPVRRDEKGDPHDRLASDHERPRPRCAAEGGRDLGQIDRRPREESEHLPHQARGPREGAAVQVREGVRRGGRNGERRGPARHEHSCEGKDGSRMGVLPEHPAVKGPALVGMQRDQKGHGVPPSGLPERHPGRPGDNPVQDDGVRHRVRIGDAIDFEIEDIVPFGVETGEPVRFQGMFHPAGSNLTIAEAKRSRINAFGIEYEGKTGLSTSEFSRGA